MTYTCTVCQKTYKTRTSLTRHAHNHSESPNVHTCEHCGIVFARKDILNRHIQKGHNNSEAGPSRQRCHTACKACRATRIRCDGEQPCQSCSVNGRACCYSSHSARISKTTGRANASRVETSGAQSSDSSSSPALNAGDTGLPSPTAERSSTANGAGIMFSETSTNANLRLEDTVMQDFNPAVYDLPIDLDGMSWPWLHESLFLQDDPLIGLFDGTGSPAIQTDTTHSRLPTGDGLAGSQPKTSFHGSNDPILAALSIPNDVAGEYMVLLNQEIDSLVDFAEKAAPEGLTKRARSDRWRNAETRFAHISGLQTSQNANSGNDTQPVLRQATELYLREFNRLWPMFSEENFDADDLNPVLYLVLVSIGSMYGSPIQKRIGTLLHKRLRRLLAGGLFDLEASDGDMLWLAHARLLTQVQGLYFGQQQGFSYAQHLGATLVAQSRRLNLFQDYRSACATPRPAMRLGQADHRRTWKQKELRRRLGFGIFRADVYTSVLLNTRPLLSSEELDMFLPYSNRLWHNSDRLPAGEQAFEIRMEEKCRPQITVSDLLRIFMDRREIIPDMGAIGYELCLFGLQLPIWKFSHDPDQFLRLTNARWQRPKHTTKTLSTASENSTLDSAIAPSILGQDASETPSDEHSTTLGGSAVSDLDALGQLHRRMRDLRQDRDRVELALESWYTGFQAARRSLEFTQHRDSLMSSLILWHTSHLQLHTPLQKLHDISYRAAEARAIDADNATAIREWTKLDDATIATKRALSICDLIHQELTRPLEKRACFNFLAFGGLHHATVVLWAASEVGTDACLSQALQGSALGSKLQNRDTAGLLQACARLFHDISPIGGCSSFGTAAEHLAGTQFPAVLCT